MSEAKFDDESVFEFVSELQQGNNWSEVKEGSLLGSPFYD